MTVVLTAVTQSGNWRVKIAWPNKTPHFFGKFQSQKEAEIWIEQHRWLIKQPQEPEETPASSADR
jgi:hypothetical protein